MDKLMILDVRVSEKPSCEAPGVNFAKEFSYRTKPLQAILPIAPEWRTQLHDQTSRDMTSLCRLISH
jgi:hypothetical protein